MFCLAGMLSRGAAERLATPQCDRRLLGVRCMKCRCTVWEVGEVREACSLMLPGSMPALDHRDAIGNRTRRHGVLRVDGVPRCRQAV